VRELARRLLNWFNPVPPERRDLAEAFDSDLREELWRLISPLALTAGLAFSLLFFQDCLLYRDHLLALSLLRVLLTVTFLATSAVGRWRRGRGSPYPLALCGIAAAGVVVGLMLWVSRDPFGPYWAFFLFIVAVLGILAWPARWLIAVELALLGVYLAAALLANAAVEPVRFFLNTLYIAFAMGGSVLFNRLMNGLRWRDVLRQQEVERLNRLLQERLDTQLQLYQQLEKEKRRADSLLNVVIPIGAALSAERDFDKLLEKILLEAKEFCNADAGTLYLRTEDEELKFVVVRNDSLDIAMGGSSGNEATLPSLDLYDPETGEPNDHNIATYAALHADSVNVPDAYEAESFDFSGTRAFDARLGYRSTSFLTIPLKGGHGRVIGVLQLINAQDPATGAIIPFDLGLQQMVESLSRLAAVALEAYIRELNLRQEIQQLRIELDEAKRAERVSEITETEYFRQLRARARSLREERS
jgi:GAF domain-containing protein